MTPLTWSDYFVGLVPALFLILFWLIPVLFAFARLRRQALDETTKAVWVLIILVVPIAGPLAYLVLFSRRQDMAGK